MSLVQCRDQAVAHAPQVGTNGALPGGPRWQRFPSVTSGQERRGVEIAGKGRTTYQWFDEQVADKRISVRAPQAIPRESLLGVLESALKMKGLALIDAEIVRSSGVQIERSSAT